MADPHKTSDAEELCASFGELAGAGALALAVSGGSDSTALMHVAALWRARQPGPVSRVSVLTVDHGLRPDSAAEAAGVGEAAAALELPHVTLAWEGGKPQSGLAERAREARYELMTGWCRANGVDRLVLAHTLDDQAETVFMRLLRGSGVDGLSAMAPQTDMAGISLIRPFLDVRRAELRDFLRQRGIAWFDDPSNADETYERVRIRKALSSFERLGLTVHELSTTARRMQRARAALEAVTATAVARYVTVHCAGWCTVSEAIVVREPAEIVQRTFSRCLQAVGGLDRPPRRSALEVLCTRFLDGDRRAGTLGGCRVSMQDDGFLIAREPGRMPRQPLCLRRGETGVWDGRFTVGFDGPGSPEVSVRPLGCDGWDMVGGRALAVPRPLREGLVSFWFKDRPVAVPHLPFHDQDRGPHLRFVAEFRGLSMLEGARQAQNLAAA